jgi:hypothetical protein
MAVAVMSSLAADTTARKQSVPPETTIAQQVLARYIKARGGQAALDKTATITGKGTFEGLEGVGLTPPAKFALLIKAPDKAFLSVTDSNGPFFREGVDGTAGWRALRANLEEMTSEQAALIRGLEGLHLPNRLTELLPKPTLKGKETLQDRETDVIEATTSEDQSFTLYFETKTGLLLRAATQFGGASLCYDWDDYRDVEGVKMPYKLVAHEGALTYTIRFTDIQRNTPVEDAKFKKPNQ